MRIGERKRVAATGLLLGTLLVCARVRAQQGANTPNAPVIKSYVNVVLVPVVLRDAQGRSMGNFKKEDFQIFDRGKPQEITGFTVQGRAAQAKEANVAAPPSEAIPATQKAPAAKRFVVFLFDDMHLSDSELMQAQRAATRMMAESLTDTDMATVLAISGSESGFTSDRAKLEQAILRLRTHGLYQHNASECPKVDYYQGDQIVNKNDLGTLELVTRATLSCANLADPTKAEKVAKQAAREAVIVGDQDVRGTLGYVREVVKKMGSLLGTRLLILISPGFFTLTPEAMTLKSQVIDAAAQGNVTISALDARGLYTTMKAANESGGGSAVEARYGGQSLSESMAANSAVMAEVADGTGGTYFHNNNDLEGGFKRLTQTPEYVYLLEFSADNVKQDGTYHELKVKVNREDVKLQARRGYFAPRPEKQKK
jgi:VWFA-related protein